MMIVAVILLTCLILSPVIGFLLPITTDKGVKRKKKKRTESSEYSEYRALYNNIGMQVIKQTYHYFIPVADEIIDNKSIKQLIHEQNGDKIFLLYLVFGEDDNYNCIFSINIDRKNNDINCKAYPYKHDIDLDMNEIMFSSKDLMNSLKQKWM